MILRYNMSLLLQTKKENSPITDIKNDIEEDMTFEKEEKKKVKNTEKNNSIAS